MSFALSKETRDKLKSRILDGKFDAEDAKLHKRWAALAEECYERQYPKKTRDLMETIPSDWLTTATYFKFQFSDLSGDVLELHFDGRFPGDYYGCNNRAGDMRKKFPYNDAFAIRTKLDATDRLTQKFYQLRDDTEDFKTRRKEMTNRVRGVLESFRTTKQLVETWPEVEQFLKDLAPVEAPRQDLAPVLGDLNKELGLKIKKAA